MQHYNWIKTNTHFVKEVGAFHLTVESREAGGYVWTVGREEEEDMGMNKTLKDALEDVELALTELIDDMFQEITDAY